MKKYSKELIDFIGEGVTAHKLKWFVGGYYSNPDFFKICDHWISEYESKEPTEGRLNTIATIKEVRDGNHLTVPVKITPEIGGMSDDRDAITIADDRAVVLVPRYGLWHRWGSYCGTDEENIAETLGIDKQYARKFLADYEDYCMYTLQFEYDLWYEIGETEEDETYIEYKWTTEDGKTFKKEVYED